MNSILKQRLKRYSGFKMYELNFDKKAIKFLNKLDRNSKERRWDKLQECKIEPFRYLRHLEQIKGYKLRVGDYRIIIDVDEVVKVLYVEKIGHRKNIYEE